ncbi:hypothetical protein SAMN05192530_11729 [Aureimonas jatrophae]|uniref:Uncharacterized protein n=1 Tax=Aureimonas jatrophae TaxID=1166073 RepID=A0A1H0N4M2_9HYPH|nr:hypothetical protein SAMN05192530_11729 [Aureimonas jatrophae]
MVRSRSSIGFLLIATTAILRGYGHVRPAKDLQPRPLLAVPILENLLAVAGLGIPSIGDDAPMDGAGAHAIEKGSVRLLLAYLSNTVAHADENAIVKEDVR